MSDKKRATITGALFIFATASAFVGDGFLGSILKAPDFLALIFANQGRVALAALFKIAAAAASAGIAMSMYPVLRRQDEGLALGSVCFRLVEGVFYLVGTLSLLTLLSLGQDYAKAGAETASQFRVAGVLLLALQKWAGFVLGVIAFCLGASMYYLVLFRTRLVPRWLSGWGLAALATLLVMVIFVMFGREPSGMMLALAFPIFLQELVLAVWLIVKGFKRSAPDPDGK